MRIQQIVEELHIELIILDHQNGFCRCIHAVNPWDPRNRPLLRPNV
jgi:hypothetical protein